MTSVSKIARALTIPSRALSGTGAFSFKINDSGSFSSSIMPENMEEVGNSQRIIANMDREFSGQQTARMFSGQFMSDQYQQSHNVDKESMDLTRGYDMDGNAHLASVLQTNLPEPFKAVNVDNLKEGVPEGLSDVVRERGQRWAMEDRLTSFDEAKNLQ